MHTPGIGVVWDSGGRHVYLVCFVGFVYIWLCWLMVVRLTQTDVVGGNWAKRMGQVVG